MTVNGFLAGLVAITCPCYWVSPVRRDHDRRDRRRGRACSVVDLSSTCASTTRSARCAVHGVCGIWGTLSLGLFATGQYGAPAPTGADNSAGAVVTGLFYGGGVRQLIAQASAAPRSPPRPSPSAMALMYAVKATGTPPRLEGRRARRPRPARARRSGLPGDGGRLLRRLFANQSRTRGHHGSRRKPRDEISPSAREGAPRLEQDSPASACR